MHTVAKINLFLILVLTFSTIKANNQADSTLQGQKQACHREIKVYSGITIFYSTLGYGLYTAWYKDYSTGHFHFFNDNQEWLKMDKMGHSFSCYSEAVNGMNLMDYVGLSKNKAMWIGSFIGLGMQTIVEIMDGYSNKWGFSWGDMGADVVGTSLALSQRYFWDEQRIKLCYSFHTSGLRSLRPAVLGANNLTGILKDYNGQTAWLSANIRKFARHSKFPPWLNVAVGYGAYNMVTGNPNDQAFFLDSKGKLHDPSHYQRYPIIYVAPDICLQEIPFIKKHRTLFIIARFLAPLKVPLPTLQYDNNHGLKFHAFYF